MKYDPAELKQKIKEAHFPEGFLLDGDTKTAIKGGYWFTGPKLNEAFLLLIDDYNKWLLDQGYTDFDIISEFELGDYFGPLDLFG